MASHTLRPRRLLCGQGVSLGAGSVFPLQPRWQQIHLCDPDAGRELHSGQRQHASPAPAGRRCRPPAVRQHGGQPERALHLRHLQRHPGIPRIPHHLSVGGLKEEASSDCPLVALVKGRRFSAGEFLSQRDCSAGKGRAREDNVALQWERFTGAKPGGAHHRLPEAPTSPLFLDGGPQATGQGLEGSLTEVLQAAPRG